MYAMILTRPDISHAVSVVSRYITSPGKKHWEGVKRIMRSLKSTLNLGLPYRRKTDAAFTKLECE